MTITRAATPLLEIPEGVLKHILSFVSDEQFAKIIPLVCKKLKEMTEDNLAWQVRNLNRFGRKGPIILASENWKESYKVSHIAFKQFDYLKLVIISFYAHCWLWRVGRS